MTAEEFLNNNIEDSVIDGGIYSYTDGVQYLMIEFAKMKVQEAVRKIIDEASINRSPTGEGGSSNVQIKSEFFGDLGFDYPFPVRYTVDKNSIINAYDLNNIK